MALIPVKIKGVRIHHVVPTKLKDGSVGTDALIDEADLPVIKALCDWTQGEKVPDNWKNREGGTLTWAGIPAVEPVIIK